MTEMGDGLFWINNFKKIQLMQEQLEKNEKKNKFVELFLSEYDIEYVNEYSKGFGQLMS